VARVAGPAQGEGRPAVGDAAGRAPARSEDDELPPGLAATVRSRIGFPASTEDVLAGEPVRDRWTVVGVRDEGDERLLVRRVWLRGQESGRPALVLSFAMPGQPLAADLVLGTTVDADLCFYPGAVPLRALVRTRHATEPSLRPDGDSIAAALAGYARALAGEPWLERWPVLLAGCVPVTDHNGSWYLLDATGDALPLDGLAEPPWPLVAAAGGTPVTVAGELTTTGVRPLTAWAENRLVRT
jgi:hypothetical protein